MFIYALIFIFLSVFQLSANSSKITFNTLADIESQALTFVKDRDGFIWIGTYVDGLYRFDGKNLVHYTKASDFILSNNVPAIMEDRDGFLWFASAGGGLTRYDKEKNTSSHFVHDPKDPASISSNSFFWAGKCILTEDEQGLIWIGTIGGGLNRLNKDSGVFTHFRHDSTNDKSLTSDNVRAVLIDSKHRVWVGTEQGLNLLNSDDKTFTRIRLESTGNTDKAQKIIMSMYEDSLGTLWVGTENNGLYQYDEMQSKFNKFQFELNDPNSIGSNRITYISEDEFQNIWISHENILSILNLKTGNIVRYEGNLYDITMSFVDLKTSLVWGLTDTGKVLIHNPEGNFFKQYRSNPEDKNSLSSEIVISIFEDSEGIIWISTIKGFNRYNPVTKEFTHFFHDPADPSSIPSTED
jgi:ligand-binding sensor domain-containing protein